MDKINVYRIGSATIFNDEINTEALYYYLGYMQFRSYVEKGCLNDIMPIIYEIGKFFFVFPEEAVGTNTLVHSKNGILMQYSLPIDDIIRRIGTGSYEYDGKGYLKLETYINKSNIQGISYSQPEELDEEEVKQAKIRYLRDLYAFRGETLYEKDVDSYKVPWFREGSIVKTDSITGKAFNFNRYESFKNQNQIALANKGLILDYSIEAKRKRKKIREAMYTDKEKAKALLLDYKSTHA